jgi:hypothetical protein
VVYTLDNATKGKAGIQFISPGTEEAKGIKNVLLKYKIADEEYPNKPTRVAELVAEKTGKKFLISNHTQAWHLYKVRPPKASKQPENTNKDFCIYHAAHEDYTLIRRNGLPFYVRKLRNFGQPDQCFCCFDLTEEGTREGSKNFTRGFLICAPGLTIKDRLRVLQPNDPDSYYANRELVPNDMLDDVNRAKIVITNFHAFKLRERIELSKGGRQLLQGRTGEELDTRETEGQMLQRMMPDLMGMKNILVINDEAHHCYREKPKEADDEELKGDDKKEAEKNNEAARFWISGLEAVNRKLGILRVLDLSATPFFLRGSGYAEGTLFPWTMSDFSLMDAIECGIVKLPRVPVAQNIPGNEMPMYRDLWENIRKDMPKKGRGQGEELDPLKLPTRLQTAVEALYGHYEKTFRLWQEKGIKVPPCFIIVCQNTAISKLVYDFVSGFIARMRTARPRCKTAGFSCSATSMRPPATHWRGPTRS